MSDFQLDDSVVWREFKRLEREAGPDGLIDLVRLWHVVGRPKRLSPRQRYPKNCPGSGDDIKILKSDGKKADSPAWATAVTAHGYVQILDPRIAFVMCDIYWAQVVRDPVGMLMDAPDNVKRLVACLIKPVVANQADRPREDADQLIIAEAIERTSGLDPYEQESRVAAVGRAVRGEKPIPRTEDQP